MAGIGAKSELLNVLSDVKARVMDKLGIADFPMPQFIIIGKQSVGKSRLIEALAGEQFNFISGTLGSRRPTILEFRNVASLSQSRWYVRDMASLQWQEHPIAKVMQIIGDAHESLGENVSTEGVYVRVESPNCVDMSCVDLPGFRDFAMDQVKMDLGKKIHDLVHTYMRDPKNVMLCVEQAGDAATMSTLGKCKEIDPKFERTILVRNKLDKYYNDLTDQNVEQWLRGFGDLPAQLMDNCYSMTLPWWPEDTATPSIPFEQITKNKNAEDISTLQGKGCKSIKTIGFNNFVQFMDVKVESLFTAAIQPVLDNLTELSDKTGARLRDLTEEAENTNPGMVLGATKDAGKTFANALVDVMGGLMGVEEGKMDMEGELRAFHEHHEKAGSWLPKEDPPWMQFPTEDFAGLDDYIDYLRTSTFMSATFDTQLSGGAAFRRLLLEVEVFLRFSEVAADTKKRDVIQARGVSMTSLTWRDVVVKLLAAEAHVPLKKRVQYVGERVTMFFESQKTVILAFMCSLDGGKMSIYSSEYSKHGKLINSNAMMKHLIFQSYDRAVRRQLVSFMELFQNMLTSTFANPWTFLKGSTIPPESDSADGAEVVDIEMRIPKEIESRSAMESVLNKWLQGIPTEAHKIDDAVDEVQKLVLRIYSLIRSQVCDQVELFTESFFKVPMLRRLAEDMSNIELTEDDEAQYAARRIQNKAETEKNQDALKEVTWCVDQLENFKLKTQMASRF